MTKELLFGGSGLLAVIECDSFASGFHKLSFFAVEDPLVSDNVVFRLREFVSEDDVVLHNEYVPFYPYVKPLVNELHTQYFLAHADKQGIDVLEVDEIASDSTVADAITYYQRQLGTRGSGASLTELAQSSDDIGGETYSTLSHYLSEDFSSELRSIRSKILLQEPLLRSELSHVASCAINEYLPLSVVASGLQELGISDTHSVVSDLDSQRGYFGVDKQISKYLVQKSLHQTITNELYPEL